MKAAVKIHITYFRRDNSFWDWSVSDSSEVLITTKIGSTKADFQLYDDLQVIRFALNESPEET